MRIYYFVSGAPEKVQRIHHRIYDVLQKEEVAVFSNVHFFQTGRLSERDMIRMRETGEFFLGKMHGVIIEGSQFSSELGYILALTLSQRRPFLYLHPQGAPMQGMLGRILEEHSTRPFIFLEYYRTGVEVKKFVREFLRRVDAPTKKEKSNLKFTLRISPRLDQYLNWKSKNAKFSKANFIRAKILEPMLEDDTEYHKKAFY